MYSAPVLNKSYLTFRINILRIRSIKLTCMSLIHKIKTFFPCGICHVRLVNNSTEVSVFREMYPLSLLC